jgi:F-type H+-transporting ATPase subunit gamma
VLANLADVGAGSSSALLLPHDDVRVVGLVVIGGDRGLCGGYNANVIRAAEGAIRRTVADGKEYHLVCVGKKVESYFKFRRYKIAAVVNGTSDRPHYQDALRVSSTTLPGYELGEIDEVNLIYTQFFSAGSQKVVERRLLPLDTTALSEAASGGLKADYEYEPAPDAILDRLVPRYVEAKLFSAMLEGTASFFAAQQRAMAAASDNADELITKLTRRRNRARQDNITTEIMEIVGGAQALSEAAT